jgi:hypothetical protein
VVERDLGSSLPPTELVRRDLTLFGEVKRLFSTVPEVRKETEANGGHQGDRTLHRTRSQFDRTRPVSSSQQSGARVLGFATGVSGPSRNRSAGQAPRGAKLNEEPIGRVRSRWDLTGLRPDARCSASGQTLERVRSRQRLLLTRTVHACPVVTGRVRSP